jgi:hypothetical protein
LTRIRGTCFDDFHEENLYIALDHFSRIDPLSDILSNLELIDGHCPNPAGALDRILLVAESA